MNNKATMGGNPTLGNRGGVGGGGGAIFLDWQREVIDFAQLYVDDTIRAIVFDTENQLVPAGVATEAAMLAQNNQETFSVVGVGSGTTKLPTAHGGVIREAAGAVAASSCNVTALGATSGTNGTLIDSALTRPFFLHSYAKLNTTPGANTLMMLMSLVGNDDKMIGIRPSVSATHLVFGLLAVGLQATTQLIPDTTQYHHYSLGWSPTSGLLQAFFDLNPIAIGSMSPVANMDNVVQIFRTHVSNGAAGGAQSVDFDKKLVATNFA